MAKIVLIGINHNDPFGRSKTVRVLKNISDNFVPECVAVEWKKEIADAVISQRVKIRNLLKNDYPLLNSSDIELLSDAMAFEADAHYEMYPSIPIIWLDQNRNIDNEHDDVKNFFEYRKSYYDSVIKRIGSADVCGISTFVCNEKNADGADSRDIAFYEVLKQSIEAENYQSIACVVGAKHANPLIKGSFADLLKKDFHEIVVYNTTSYSMN